MRRLVAFTALSCLLHCAPAQAHHYVHQSYGDPRPHAWCGWYMRQIKGVADRAYNLARNWAHWGRPGIAGIGAIVVWPHHVGEIVGRSASGEWIIRSGNDGHTVRERPRPIGGAIAIRWG